LGPLQVAPGTWQPAGGGPLAHMPVTHEFEQHSLENRQVLPAVEQTRGVFCRRPSSGSVQASIAYGPTETGDDATPMCTFGAPPGMLLRTSMKRGKLAATRSCLSFIELELSMRNKMSTLRLVTTLTSFRISPLSPCPSDEMSRDGQPDATTTRPKGARRAHGRMFRDITAFGPRGEIPNAPHGPPPLPAA